MHNSTNLSKYKTKNILKRKMIEKFKRKILSILDNYDLKYTILDVGCGEGFISNYIYKTGKHRLITGIDIDKGAIDFAKGNNKCINYMVGDVNKTSSNKKYDIVMALEILEHLENPDKTLKNIMSLSKRQVIISVPNEPFFSLGNLLSLKNVKRFGTPSEHINIWTKKKFIQFLESNNIRDYKLYRSFPWLIIVITK